ncbi:MAG: cysteine hydrolase [Burkholderiaceae bacterium]|jgi:nicotinamidase-related amidase|nr:cysteine hydrolase [Burkholderiaceae bacterium]
MTSSAVLLMDLQVDFLDAGKGRMPVSAEGAARVIAAANAVLSANVLPGALAVAVVNRFPRSQVIANFFRKGAAVEGSDGARLDSRVRLPPAVAVFAKSRASAFSNPDLHPWLQGRSVSRLCVMGVMAEGCVRATAIAARALGYEVVAPLDAIATNATWKLRFAVWSMRRHGVGIGHTLAALS